VNSKGEIEMGKYNQLCVWPACYLGEYTPEMFVEFMSEKFGVRIKFAEEVTTTGGRIDLLFYVNDDDICNFAVKRLAYGIRWWEDVLDNGQGAEYLEATLKKYPYTWEKPIEESDNDDDY